MRGTLRLLALAGAAVTLGALWPVDGLEIENAARGQRWRLALPPGGSFAITSHHSMYDQPYTETFAFRKKSGLPLKETLRQVARELMFVPFTYNLDD